MSIASPKTATGPSDTEKSVRDPDRLPISMFCGFPVMAATLPMFDAVASAIRRARTRPRDRAISMSTGVKTRQIVSLTKSADSVPAANTTASSSATGWLMLATIHRASTRKSRASPRLATSTIMPNSMMIVR